MALGALPFFFLNSASATAGAALFARWMDADAYGGFVFAVHMAGLVALVGSLGFPQAAVRFLPRYRDADPQLYRGFLTAGLAIQVLGGALAGGLAWLILEIAAWEGHSVESLRHAWWLVPILGLNVFLANVDTSAGRLRANAVAHGLARHALAIALGVAVVASTGGLSADEAIVAFGAAAAIVVVAQLIGRWRDGDRLAPRRLDMSPWLKVAASLGVIWGLRVLGSSGDVLILRSMVGEAEAGGYHLANAWAGLVAIPAITYAAAASRTIAGSHDPAVAGAVARRALRRSVLPTVAAALVVLPTALYFMEHPGSTHTLAEFLLAPLVPAWGLRGLEALVLSGLALRGLHARATTLAVVFTVLALGVSVVLAATSGAVAVGWGVLVVRVVFVAILVVGVRGVAGRAEAPAKPGEELAGD